MDVGMGAVFNLAAARTFVAAIGGGAGNSDRILAIQGFGQGAGEQFQFFELVAGKQVGMAEPPAREGALEQFDRPGFVRENL